MNELMRRLCENNLVITGSYAGVGKPYDLRLQDTLLPAITVTIFQPQWNDMDQLNCQVDDAIEWIKQDRRTLILGTETV